MPPLPVTAPTLTDGVVTLRAVGEQDVDALVEQCRDPETVRWTTVPAGYTPDDARDFVRRTVAEWDSGDRAGWAIEWEGRFAGLVSHRPRGLGVVEIAFAAHPASRGQGLMSRAVRLVAEHAFAHGAELALWHAHVGNFGSRKVAWRTGFQIGGPITTVRQDQVVEVWAGWLRVGEPMEPRNRWLDVPDLTGDGVRLRAFRDADQTRFPQVHDELTRQFSDSLPVHDAYPAWLLGVRTRAAEGRSLSFAVVDPGTDRLLGGVDLSRLDVPLFAGTGILGFWLLPDARGRGVVGRALDLVLPWAFRPQEDGGLGLHQVTAGCVEGNWGSARVLRRAGFALVGTERQSLRSDGLPCDALLFDLLATDDRDAQRLEPLVPPVVETEHYRLRPWRDDDVPTDGEGPDDASLRFMPPRVHPDADAYPAWLKRRRLRSEAGTGLDWCIADRATDHALGTLTIFAFDAPGDRYQAEIGYWLHPPARGRGALVETLPAAVEHAFTAVAAGGLGLARLHAVTDPDNAASQKLLLRNGFRHTGRERSSFRTTDGDLTGAVSFELLAADERVDRRGERASGSPEAADR